MAITKDQIREIVIYAGSVIDVNESAAEDVELLLERVDDEFQIEQMPPDDFKRIERAICKAHFGYDPGPDEDIYFRVWVAPVALAS